MALKWEYVEGILLKITFMDTVIFGLQQWIYYRKKTEHYIIIYTLCGLNTVTVWLDWLVDVQRNRFCSINQKVAETEEELRK